MPLNNLANRSHSLEVDGIVTLLESTINSVSSARTVEDRLLLEARVVELFKKILSGDLELPKVSPNLSCDRENFGLEKSNLKYKTDINMSKLEKLAQTYIDSYNTKVKQLLEITGSLKRVRQKKAALDLWDREKAKWVIAEKFFNFDFLSTSDIGEQVLDIDTTEGIATLPIKSIEEVKPKSVYLSNGNGQPGNSDKEVTTNNILPQYMFDEDSTTYFEYERLDSGPAKVTIGCDFSTTNILNRIQIRPAAIPNSLSFEIENIIFYLPGNKSISIKEHISSKVTFENFVVKSVGNDVFWQMTFAPISCNSVKILFKQENSHLLNISTKDGRVSSRKRYSIGIKHIGFQKIEFENKGGISSQAIEIPEGLYAAESTSDVFPKNPNLFSASLDFSGDGGETWNLDVFGFEESQTPNTIKLQGEASDIFWRLYVERNDNSFLDISSFVNDDISYNVNVVSHMISLNQSPNSIPLKDKPYNRNISVYHPRICRRTDDPREAIKLATSPRLNAGEGFTINLPIELDSPRYSLSPDEMTIYAGNRELYAQEDSLGNAVSFPEIQFGVGGTDSIWAIDNDWKRIAVQHRRQLAEITWKFPSQRLLLEERSNGFYARFSDDFDPDKDRIRISHLPSTLTNSSIKVSLITKIITLPHKNISPTSVYFSSGDSITFTLTSSLVDVKNDTGSAADEILYYVDSVNGRIYLSKAITQVITSDIGPVKVTYSHSASKVLDDDLYKIWGEDNEVYGVIINPEAVVTKDRTFYPWSSPTKDFDNIDVRSGNIVTKEKFFATTSKRFIDLPDSYIVMNSVSVSPNMFENNPEIYPREVPYEDGRTEFLGLKSMNSEETVEIVSDNTGVVSFNLAAGAAYYSELGVVFEDTTVFVNINSALTSVGDYTISTEGKVEIRVATAGSSGTLPSGINYSYSYKDPSFVSRGLYSIDYVNGLLYTATDVIVDNDPMIKYKVANYKAEYDIVKKVDTWSYSPESNSVLIRTEKTSSFPITRRMKVYYFTRDEYTPIKNLKNYFSPIFYNISFRFQ